MKDKGAFITQKGRRRGHSDDVVGANQPREVLAGTAQTSQSTLLLRKKKEMREVDDALEFMKEEYNKCMENCDQREAEFRQKQAEMREQVLKFEKFIQENDAKRARAEAKAKQERRISDNKTQELRRLEKELAEAMEEEEKLKEQRQKLKRYQDYLIGTSLSTDDPTGQEVNDLLNRFQTLREANIDLMKLCEDHDTSYERRRTEMQQYRQDKQNEVLVTNSELNSKQLDLEQIRSAVKRAEHKSEEEGERVKGVCRESGQVMLAINNLHSRCRQTARTRQLHSNKQALDKMPFLERCLHCLHVVAERIEDLGEIQAGYGGNWPGSGGCSLSSGVTNASVTNTKGGVGNRQSREHEDGSSRLLHGSGSPGGSGPKRGVAPTRGHGNNATGVDAKGEK